MSGLIWKDVLVMRKTLKGYALFLALYMVMAVMGMFDVSMVTAMIEIIVMMLPIGAFAYDEQAKWDRYAAVLPMGRRSMVAARYLFTLVTALCAAVFGALVCVILSILGRAELAEGLATVLAAMGMGIFIADIMLPLCYKLGAERARPYLYLVVFLPVLLLFGAFQLGLLDNLDLSWLESLPESGALAACAVVPLLALAGLVVSYLISCRVMEGKEF